MNISVEHALKRNATPYRGMELYVVYLIVSNVHMTCVTDKLQYIKRMISKGSTPVLTLVEKRTVDVDYPREEYYMPSLPKREKPKAKGCAILILLFSYLYGCNYCNLC